MSVLVVLPIYHREPEVRACLRALEATQVPGRVDLGFAINGASAGLLEALAGWSWRAGRDGCVASHVMPGNFGKGRAVNRVVERMGAGHDFVVSLDSDMIATSAEWLVRLVDAWERTPASARIGALVSDQSVYSCHRVVSPEDVSFGWPAHYTGSPGNEGIAGGCLFTPLDLWREIGGYRNKTLHGREDGQYLFDLRLRNLRAVICRPVVFEHPLPRDWRYEQWKTRSTDGTLAREERAGYTFDEADPCMTDDDASSK